jgi:hypothetical protein
MYIMILWRGRNIKLQMALLTELFLFTLTVGLLYWSLIRMSCVPESGFFGIHGDEETDTH